MRKGSSPGSRPRKPRFDEYLSDPNKPVPYIGALATRVLNSYMTEDQRFAAARPDVLVYKTDVLDHDVNVFGPIAVDLKVSTTGTDSDFDVKLIDVYPGDSPDYNAPAGAGARRAARPRLRSAWAAISNWSAASRSAASSARASKSRCRSSPASPTASRSRMPDIAHTFRAGHRIMVQIQSSLVPADGPQSAEVHGYSEGAVDGLRESHAAGLFRRGGRVAADVPDGMKLHVILN